MILPSELASEPHVANTYAPRPDPDRPRRSTSVGVNLIGHATASIGLGVALRQMAHALTEVGVPVQVLDVPATMGRDGFDHSLEPLIVDQASRLEQPVTLVVLGLSELPRFVAKPPEGLRRGDRLHAACVWWELPDLPEHLVDTLRTFDVLVAASPFIRDTLLRQIPDVPILLAPQPLALPAGIRADRSRFQLPADHFIAYLGFELASGLQRKHPFAAIEAFRRAFPADPKRTLLIKLNAPAAPGLAEPPELVHLRSIVRQDPRIRILRERLSEAELLSLYASCDVGLSLHRSEGFGLFPLEFMRLGKPVVATAWSGNLAYMNHSNACLVGARLVPVEPDTPSYGVRTLGIRSHWAEPDIKHAAAWLRALATDPDRRARIGERAQAGALDYDAQARKLVFVDELAGLLEELPHRPTRDDAALMQAAVDSTARHEQRRAARQRRADAIGWLRALPVRIRRKLAKLLR